MSAPKDNLKNRITVRLDDAQQEAVGQYARDKGIDKPSTVCRVALVEFLKKEGYLPDSVPKHQSQRQVK